MMQLVDVKKDAVRKPVPQTTPQEEQTRTLALRIEALEERIAPCCSGQH
jgi:hypothetical protein